MKVITFFSDDAALHIKKKKRREGERHRTTADLRARFASPFIHYSEHSSLKSTEYIRVYVKDESKTEMESLRLIDGCVCVYVSTV